MSSGLDEKDAEYQADALNNKEYKATPPEFISLKTPPSPDGKETAHVAAVLDSERQYLTGFKLAVVLGSLTLISFLVLLDMSIIGTVRLPIGNPRHLNRPLTRARPSPKSPPSSMPSTTWVGTSAPTTS
jgi:hypothetical protein